MLSPGGFTPISSYVYPLMGKGCRSNSRKPNIAYREYAEFENIGYKNDHWHTIFRSLPDNINRVTRVSGILKPKLEEKQWWP